MFTKKNIEELVAEKNYDELIKLVKEDKSKHSKVLRYTQRLLYVPFNEPIKWYAVAALGELTRNFKDEDEELYLNVLRRYVWALNDESINVPWGAAEAMGSIILNSLDKFSHFTSYLITYALENFIFFPGLLWSLGEIAQKDKSLVEPFLDQLLPFIDSDDLDVLTYAIIFIEKMELTDQIEKLKTLEDNEEEVTVFTNGKLVETTIGELAKKAVKTLSK